LSYISWVTKSSKRFRKGYGTYKQVKVAQLQVTNENIEATLNKIKYFLKMRMS
jgi:hypothetical protein